MPPGPVRLPFAGVVESRAPLMQAVLILMVWCAALAFTILVHPYVRGTTFAFFWMAVLYAAWRGGVRYAVIIALASVLASNLLNQQVLRFAVPDLSDFIDFGTFVVAASLVSALASRAARTTELMRVGEAQFRTLAEVSPVGIVIASPELDSVYMNPRAIEITGLAAHELTAERWRDLMHPEDREVAFAHNTAFRTKAVDEDTREFRLLRPNGELRHVRVMGRWIRSERTGEHEAMVLALDDLTRERVLEAQLQHAQKMEAVGQLAGGIAHDFNNLLTVVSGNLEFLRHDLPAQHPAQEDVAQIAAAVARARTLVKQLLAFGRRQMLRPQVVDIACAVTDARSWFVRLLGEEIRCAVAVHEPHAGALRVMIDRAQLDQVLVNLAMNARDAMLTGDHGHHGRGGDLCISADRTVLSAHDLDGWAPLGPGAYVRLRVRDTGHGMDAPTRHRAFDPFFTTRPLGKGSGLGLATVEGIVAQSGGAVRVESTIGEGTVFTILLPVAS